MHAHLIPADHRIARPWYAWLGVALELATAVTAIPVGWMLMTDPTGAGIGLPSDWIESSPFGSYLIPGLYLFAVNGVGMVIAAVLTGIRHWSAPWLTAALGVGLIVWILVQLAIMPETMWLQWTFLSVGIAMGLVALFWLRRTDQLRLW
ncbi:MAG TPA: hypothetical protein VIF84_01460 [Candidatus Limnocylindrales bacterium]|jgi:hypothetical protein